MSNQNFDDEDEQSDDLFYDHDAYQSSSPSIHEDEIDFQFVYALKTFTATEQGQANAVKGDAMILLNDTNSYWWLVRLVKDDSVGFLPAEHIETPTERLARLNKHRNSEFPLPASFLFSSKKRGENDKNDASKKSVTFTQTLTFFSTFEEEYSEADDADIEDDDSEEEQYEEARGEGGSETKTLDFNSSDSNTSDSKVHETNENLSPAPLVINKHKSNPSLESESLNSTPKPVQTVKEPNNTQPLSKLIAKFDSNNNDDNSSKNNTLNRSNSTGSVVSSGNSLFSRISKSVGRRHSSIPSSTVESKKLDSHPNSGTQNENSTAPTTNGFIHFGSNNKPTRQRSLTKTKSSTENLKRGINSPTESNGHKFDGIHRFGTGSPTKQSSNSTETANSQSSQPAKNTLQSVPETDDDAFKPSESNYTSITPLNFKPVTSGTDKSENHNSLNDTKSSMNLSSKPLSNGVSDKNDDISIKATNIDNSTSAKPDDENSLTAGSDSSHPATNPLKPLSLKTKQDTTGSDIISRSLSENNNNDNDNSNHKTEVDNADHKKEVENADHNNNEDCFNTISHSSSEATGLVLISPTTPSTANTSTFSSSSPLPLSLHSSISSTLSPSATSSSHLHPQIVSIYQGTVVKLDQMSSRIDTILQKYHPVVAVS